MAMDSHTHGHEHHTLSCIAASSPSTSACHLSPMLHQALNVWGEDSASTSREVRYAQEVATHSQPMTPQWANTSQHLNTTHLLPSLTSQSSRSGCCSSLCWWPVAWQLRCQRPSSRRNACCTPVVQRTDHRFRSAHLTAGWLYSSRSRCTCNIPPTHLRLGQHRGDDLGLASQRQHSSCEGSLMLAWWWGPAPSGTVSVAPLMGLATLSRPERSSSISPKVLPKKNGLLPPRLPAAQVPLNVSVPSTAWGRCCCCCCWVIVAVMFR